MSNLRTLTSHVRKVADSALHDSPDLSDFDRKEPARKKAPPAPPAPPVTPTTEHREEAAGEGAAPSRRAALNRHPTVDALAFFRSS